MRLQDWYNFNFGNEQFRCNIGDIYVKVFRKESLRIEEMIFEQLMNPSDMVHLFGDYKMFILKKNTKNNDCTLCVCICKAD